MYGERGTETMRPILSGETSKGYSLEKLQYAYDVAAGIDPTSLLTAR